MEELSLTLLLVYRFGILFNNSFIIHKLILGDRYTGKTSIYLSLIIKLNIINIIGSIDGLGTRRIFGIYIGINQNLII